MEEYLWLPCKVPRVCVRRCLSMEVVIDYALLLIYNRRYNHNQLGRVAHPIMLNFRKAQGGKRKYHSTKIDNRCFISEWERELTVTQGPDMEPMTSYLGVTDLLRLDLLALSTWSTSTWQEGDVARPPPLHDIEQDQAAFDDGMVTAVASFVHVSQLVMCHLFIGWDGLGAP